MVDFLVIGHFNAIKYKDVFPHIMNDKIRLGYNRVSEFCDGSKFGNTIWFTTFYVDKPPFLELTRTYDDSYKKFDNYNAINVDRTNDIPDYDGVMGVPITFLEKWNPGQFNIVGLLYDGCYNHEGIWYGSGGLKMTSINGKLKYSRILIKKK